MFKKIKNNFILLIVSYSNLTLLSFMCTVYKILKCWYVYDFWHMSPASVLPSNAGTCPPCLCLYPTHLPCLCYPAMLTHAPCVCVIQSDTIAGIYHLFLCLYPTHVSCVCAAQSDTIAGTCLLCLCHPVWHHCWYMPPVSAVQSDTITCIYPLCLCHPVLHHYWHISPLSVPSSLTPLLAYIICFCACTLHMSPVSVLSSMTPLLAHAPFVCATQFNTIAGTCPPCLCLYPTHLPCLCYPAVLVHAPVSAVQSDTITGIYPLLSVPPSLTPLLTHAPCVCACTLHVSHICATQQCWHIVPCVCVILSDTIAGKCPLCLCHPVWHHCWHMPHLSVLPSLTPLLAYVICVCLYPTHVSCVCAVQSDTIAGTCHLCLCHPF